MMTYLRFAAAALVLASPMAAQGNISTQGYGFPQGQLSTRALSMGGGIGEVDASSAVNPGSLGRLATRTVMFQMEPEFRSVTTPTGSDRTTTARYPLVTIGVPWGERWVIGVTSSSLLDRSWATTSKRTQVIGTSTVESTVFESSNGAMNDLRFSGTWTNRSWLYLGMGVHAVTGRNVVNSLEEYNDSSFNAFSSTRVLSYTGSAVSVGAQVTSSELHTAVGLSYRMGNSLRVRTNDTTLAKGGVPDHFGVAVGFTGISGTVLAARVSRDRWSAMTPMLATAGEKAHDSWDIGGGAEVEGPHVFGQTLLVRAGARNRTLPFEAASKIVREKSASFGSGMNFGGGRMSTDATIIRQWRESGLSGVKERAWTLSVSLTARP